MTKQRDAGAPYWLLKIDGVKHGFATVDFWDAQSSDAAIEAWWTTDNHAHEARILGIDRYTVTATLVTLSYVDGQPVVTAVT